ncbi:MAG: type II toxin-antitoxin system RelE/ParE family toxin [Actinobacteria bacterium HGW-Actinobacteria-4]|nr:MAG: type II toxin-antitoxin system RelE/ParE family toxin [Actinobacteria bacterium HGW-Actinobacteria-4]
MYRVEFTRAAAKQLRKLPVADASRVLEAFRKLATVPRPRGSTRLAGEQSAWRIRVGNYRVIYDVLDVHLVVTIVRIGHRRDVYRR